jgi:hypothetical protein
MSFENKNEKQLYFNQTKGTISEIIIGDRFCSIAIVAGHENPRDICFTIKTSEYQDRYSKYEIGDKVAIKFYLASRKKNDRWYTNANILDIAKD